MVKAEPIKKMTQIQVSMTDEERMHIEGAAILSGEDVQRWCLTILSLAATSQRNGWLPRLTPSVDQVKALLSKPTAAELAAKFGIKTGATIEEVEPGLPGSLGPGAVPQSLTGESDLQTNDDTQRAEFIRKFGRQALEMGLKMPSFRKAEWPQRFEIAEGKRERGE